MAQDDQQDQTQTQPQGNQIVLRCDQFQGLNTSTTRPGVPETQCYWIDGFMPIDRFNLRTLYGIGPAKYTSVGTTIVFFVFAVLNGNPIAVVVQGDGSVIQVNMNTGTPTTILTAGSIVSPLQTTVGISQWNEQYVIIVADNGYWLWDGTIVYGAGTLAPPVTMTNVGSGYTSVPNVVASGGHGSGATFLATVSGGEVISIAITNPGSGYQGGDSVTLTIDPPISGMTATATVTIMPIGITGSTVETYSGHVWVANGANVNFSAPGNPADFSSTNGGGGFISSSSVLRQGYIRLIQSNGFLYLIGDSSTDYISGVQTSTGPPPVTTYTLLNADPQVGSPYPYSIDAFGRDILMVNAVGVYVAYGGALQKVSDPLDGIWTSVPGFGGLFLSAAQAVLFGKKVWMVLAEIHDPVLNTNVIKLLMWNGRYWWASAQDVTLSYIKHQEVNSNLTAWGTDGTHLYPLFTLPTSNFQKTVQTKYWDAPIGYQVGKANTRFWLIGHLDNILAPGLDVFIENETGLVGASSILQIPSIIGYYVWPPQQIAQQGVLSGYTLVTSAADFTIIAMSMDSVRVQDRF